MSEKKIDTLVEDIYGVLKDGAPDVSDGVWTDFGDSVARVVRERLSRSDRVERKGTLRMSNIGKPCSRQLWYEVNDYPREELTGSARLKFLFGDLIEELLLLLSVLSGHKVEGRQDEQEIAGVLGHRDAVVDGVTVDTKSASTYSFKKFEEHGLVGNDPFGYVDQIQSYIEAGKDDPIVTDKDRGAFLVVDKTLGNICLDVHKKQSFPIEKMYEYKKELVARPRPPSRHFEDEPDGKSGNRKLGMECSYCPFKQECWPGLRTFLYSNKPVFLTKVLREPKVPELKVPILLDTPEFESDAS